MSTNVGEQRITDFLIDELGSHLLAVMLHRRNEIRKLYVSDEWSGLQDRNDLDVFIEDLRAQVKAMVDTHPDFSLPAHVMQGTREQRVAYILSDTGSGLFFCLDCTPGDGPKCGYVLEECISHFVENSP